MNRIYEALAHATVFAPQSVAASTAKTSDYVDVSAVEELQFLLSTAALGAGKKVKATLMAADSADGDGAVAVGEAEFTDPVGTAPTLAVVSYRPIAAHGRYVAVKFQHDAAAAVVCGATVSTRVGCLPAANSWKLVL